MASFEAHGEYAIRTHGRVARVDAWGPWNIERTIEYVQRLHACMCALPAPFGLLLISHIQPILSPDAEAILRLSVNERVVMGCTAQATVLLDPSTISVAKSQYVHIYVPAGLRHAIFTDVNRAGHWLTDNGFADAADLLEQDVLPVPADAGA